MADVTAVALRLVRLYGPLALCLFTFLETSMLFPFLPSEVVVPAAAAVLVTDPPSLLLFVAAATVGGTTGSFVPFYVFRRSRGGGPDWIRERIQISEAHVDRGQRWFEKWGQSAVLWGRFLPALRSVVSIPAGLAKMDPTRFGAYTAIGTLGFYAATGGLVYFGREQALFTAILALVTANPVATAVLAALLLGIGLSVRRWVRQS